MALSIYTSVVSTKELTKTALKETGWRRTSWLFTSEAEDLNSGLPRANPAPTIPAYVLKPRETTKGAASFQAFGLFVETL